MESVVRHPGLGDVTVSQSRRSKRLSITVNRHGTVRLSFPYGCTKKTAWDFLLSNAEKVEQIRNRILEKNAARVTVIRPPYATLKHTLEFAEGDTGRINVRVGNGKVLVKFPHDMPHDNGDLQEMVRKGLAKALCIEGSEILPPIVEELAARHGFRYRSVTVRTTTSRWGSCSSRDDISLSAYLVRLPRRLIEFIVLHELCHTRHKDHSPAFHALLDSVTYGNEKKLNRELKQHRTGF